MFPLVSIIIPTHNRKNKLKRLINSIFTSKYPHNKLELIIINDASTDGTKTFLQKLHLSSIRQVKIVNNKKNSLVSVSRNKGIKKASGKYLFFVDDDVVLAKDTISNLVNFSQKDKNKSLVGPIICYWSKGQTVWFAGLKMSLWTTGGKFLYQDKNVNKIKNKKPIKSDGLLTAFIAPRQLINKIGFFNEKLFPFGFEDIDFCIRARLLGYKLFVLPWAKVFHDHQKGFSLFNSWRLYFGAKTRPIAYKLWSKNSLQSAVAQFFSIIFAFVNLAVSLFLLATHRSLKQAGAAKSIARFFLNIKSTSKGLKDGLILSSKTHPYRKTLKEGKSIKHESSD